MLSDIEKYSEEELVYHLKATKDPVIQCLYRKALEKYEPILTENSDRFVIFPISDQDIWKYYKDALASFWITNEISLTDDVLQWRSNDGRIDEGTKQFIKQILAFFACADGIVNENLASNFFSEIQIPEGRAFYGFQIMIENIHGEMYSLLIDSYIELQSEKNHLFNSIHSIPSVKKMGQWALKWINRDRPFSERLIAFACVEAIMFSGPFAAIYWIKRTGLLPGLCHANELISRDEALHAQFACLLNSKLKYPAPDQTIIEIVREAVDLEIEFIVESIPCRLVGMNSDLMTQYIKFVADRLLVQLGVDKIYNVTNPFSFMDLISVDSKTNFFERRSGEYSKPGFTSSGEIKKNTIQLLDDF